MAICYPNRRVLGLPAWLWVLLPIVLLGFANVLCTVWPPSKLAEPSVRAEIFREIVLVGRQGDSFRFISFGEHNDIKPLWAVSVIVRETSTVRWQGKYFLPGLFLLESRWTYELTVPRFDKDWEKDNDNPFALPDEQVRQLRPLVVAELNRRNASALSGDRLEGLLTDGLERSSYLCPQNAIILLSWLFLLMSIIGLISMAVPPRTKQVAKAPTTKPGASPDKGLV